MQEANNKSRLYCEHYVPSNIACSDCHAIEKDYKNRPLYAPLYVPLPELPTVINSSQLKLPNTFYVPMNENSKSKNNCSTYLTSDDCVELNTKNGIVRVPRSTLVQRCATNESMKNNNQCSTRNVTCNSQEIFPGDFKKHAHRFTRSFSWKTKPEEPPFAQMQPLPKLIKRPGYIEMCCKNICWPTHQLCLCCTRNVADSCRKWSKSTGEYDYIDACWSSCALCSDDAYKILNTPVVYNEKIIDPELLLPLDAELLYYSIQSAKRQKAKQQNILTESLSSQQPSQNQQQQNTLPFSTIQKTIKELPSSVTIQEQQRIAPSTSLANVVEKSKQVGKMKSLKPIKTRKKSSTSNRKKNRRKKSSRSRSPSSKKRSSRSKNHSKRKSKS